MRIVLARLQSLKAVALSNEGPDSRSATLIDKMTALGDQVDIQLPEVLIPPAEQVTSDPAPVPDGSGGVGGVAMADAVGQSESPAPAAVPEQVTETQPAPVPAVEAAPVEQVTPPPADALPNADGASQPVAEQVTEMPTSVSGTSTNPNTPTTNASPSTVDGATAGVSPDSVVQADPGDEDPTPPEKETMESVDRRLDALEGHPRGGKVSRQ